MLWKTKEALVIFSLLGVGSLVYLLLRKKNEEDDTFCCTPTKISIESKGIKERVDIFIERWGNPLRSTTTIEITDDVGSSKRKWAVKRNAEPIALARTIIELNLEGPKEYRTNSQAHTSTRCRKMSNQQPPTAVTDETTEPFISIEEFFPLNNSLVDLYGYETESPD